MSIRIRPPTCGEGDWIGCGEQQPPPSLPQCGCTQKHLSERPGAPTKTASRGPSISSLTSSSSIQKPSSTNPFKGQRFVHDGGGGSTTAPSPPQWLIWVAQPHRRRLRRQAGSEVQRAAQWISLSCRMVIVNRKVNLGLYQIK